MARLPLILTLLLLIGVAIGLRLPTFGFRCWNVDEAIHATIARTLLADGVLYRDAVDQRTPLTYVAAAGIFAVAGENNFTALHVSIACLIGLTAGLISWLACQCSGRAAALWTGGVFLALSTGLLHAGDAFAFSTEWFVGTFTAIAACTFWAAPVVPSSARLAATGLAFALAFLSKQPALLDLAAPIACLLLARRQGTLPGNRIVRPLIALLAGFTAPIAIVYLYYFIRGTGGDYLFFTWSYNLDYYGPEVSTADRIRSILALPRMLAEFSPVVLVVAGVSLLAGVWVFARPAADGRGNPVSVPCYLWTWFFSSLAAAASGGRAFDHYFIQVLPALSLLLGLGLGRVTEYSLAPTRSALWRFLATACLGGFAIHLFVVTVSARARTQPTDPSWRIARFIATHTQSDDRIFVWGFHPDIYVLSDRRAGSRFVYNTFQSGLIPWTNTAPDRDTTYARVPGAMSALLTDLVNSRPAFIVDCSAGPNRHWNKYPIADFPELAELVATHYRAIESDQFTAQGFHLYAIRDEFRRNPPRFPPAPATTSRAGRAELFVIPTAQHAPLFRIAAHDPIGQLCRIELWVNESRQDSITIAPGTGFIADLRPDTPLSLGQHRLQARALSADGTVFTSPVEVVEIRESALPPERLAELALPVDGQPLPPLLAFAPLGASVEKHSGRTYYFAHAPARIVYPLPGTAPLRLKLSFGIRPEAYAARNQPPTDGADFRIAVRAQGRPEQILLNRRLQPATAPADGGEHSLSVEIPGSPNRLLELCIAPGPRNDPACDWTYWSDLTLENSR